MRVAGGALRFRPHVVVAVVAGARVGAFAVLGGARGLTRLGHERGVFVAVVVVRGTRYSFAVADGGGDDLLSVAGGVHVDMSHGGCEACLFALVALVFVDGARELFVGTGRDACDDGGGENIRNVAVLVFHRVVDMAVGVFVGGGLNVGVGVGMAVAVATVGVAVVMEEEKAENVGG